MDHPSSRVLARYALGEVTDEDELASLEEHLMECEECCRRAVAVDLIGTSSEPDAQLLLHIAAINSDPPTALCGDESSRNLVSELLLSGINANLVCRKCLTLLRAGSDSSQYVN